MGAENPPVPLTPDPPVPKTDPQTGAQAKVTKVRLKNGDLFFLRVLGDGTVILSTHL